MEIWRLIDLGMADPWFAQTFYEAVAHAVDNGTAPNTIILVQPSHPYVCLGLHQELEKEIDLEYCRSNNLLVIRRSQGGGATYLDSDQVFYQIIARKESKAIPLSVEQLFRKLLKVTVYVYQKLGLPAEFKPPNDVIVNGRKISGNGAGEFGTNTIIFVGNIILDLNCDAMASVLKVPSEKFRNKMIKSIREWITSLKKELGYVPPIEQIKKLLVEGYETLLGIKLIPSNPTELEKNIWEHQVKPRHLSREWLYMPEFRQEEIAKGTAVKVAADVKIIEATHRAAKLIRVTAELAGHKILHILISGDFFMTPIDTLPKLELNLKGATLNREEVLQRIREFYIDNKVQTPGVTPEDFADAIMKLKELA